MKTATQRANHEAAFNGFEREVFSVEAAMAFADCSKSALYSAIKDGLLKAHKRGRRTVIFRSNLIEWLNTLPLKTGPSAVHAERARQRWVAEHAAE